MSNHGIPSDIFRLRARVLRTLQGLRTLLDRGHPSRAAGDESSGSGRTYRAVLAVSGGSDSMMLLHVICELGSAAGIEPVVAHVDHRLRSTSVQDAALVADAAERLGARFLSRAAPERPPGENVEKWAREIRYRLLEEMRQESGAEVILTAHHANDQEETVLMRILSGRAVGGGLGIMDFDPARRLFRPLLALRREDLRRYVEHYRLPFVHDETNDDLTRTRNRLRAELAPALREDYNPDLSTVLGELAARSLADEQYLEQCALLHVPGPGFRGERFAEVPPPLRWRALRRWVAAQCGEQAARRTGYRALQRLADCIVAAESRERTIELGGGMCARFSTLDGLRIDFGPAAPPSRQEIVPDELVPALPWTVRREYRDGSAVELVFSLIEQPHAAAGATAVQHSPPGGGAADWIAAGPASFVDTVRFDADKIDIKSLQVGERRQGETMRTSRGEQRIKKLLQEAGLPLTLRDRIPIVRAGSWVLWVPGVARSQFATVDQNSARLLDISCRRIT